MSETQTDLDREGMVAPWLAGVIGGLVGALGFGLVMVFVIPAPVLEVAIPNMYGIGATPDNPAELFGWIIHLSHGAILGVVFAALLRVEAVGTVATDTARTAVVGLLYGIVIWVVLAVIVMPIWLGAVGFPGAPPLPNVSELSLLGHALYGVLLGIVYDVLTRP